MAPLAWFTKLVSLTAKRWWLLRRSYKISGSRLGYKILISLFYLSFKLGAGIHVDDVFIYSLCVIAWQNRELQIMRKLDHCNIVRLRYFFYSSGEKVRPFFLHFTYVVFQKWHNQITSYGIISTLLIVIPYTFSYMYSLSQVWFLSCGISEHCFRFVQGKKF